jgi:tRNA1Val (adenine37-N6)-methyltransferase
MTAPRRPLGWIAPGPPPHGPRGNADLAPRDDEDLSYLSGDWRLFQPRVGHRYSLDDLVTAWIATRDRDGTSVTRVLDLGCGLGSVLLMLAWRLPAATLIGIEAQVDRAALGRRSIAYNGCADRCHIVDGDLRQDVTTIGCGFDLITATPPYFPRGTGTESGLRHAAACRFELRGGVEAYLQAAATVLAPDGAFVMCSSMIEHDRVARGAQAVALHGREHWQIIPREGKAPLIAVDVFDHSPAAPTRHTLSVRDRAGAWTPEFRAVRVAMGMPDQPPRPLS